MCLSYLKEKVPKDKSKVCPHFFFPRLFFLTFFYFHFLKRKKHFIVHGCFFLEKFIVFWMQKILQLDG